MCLQGGNIFHIQKKALKLPKIENFAKSGHTEAKRQGTFIANRFLSVVFSNGKTKITDCAIRVHKLTKRGSIIPLAFSALLFEGCFALANLKDKRPPLSGLEGQISLELKVQIWT